MLCEATNLPLCHMFLTEIDGHPPIGLIWILSSGFLFAFGISLLFRLCIYLHFLSDYKNIKNSSGKV